MLATEGNAMKHQVLAAMAGIAALVRDAGWSRSRGLGSATRATLRSMLATAPC